MSNITVKFIDRDYSVPEDLLVYLDLLDLTNDVRMALNKSFYQILRNEEVGCIGDEQIRPEIDKQVGRFIAKLMEAGVYDRTVTDYLNGNKGFELISKVNQTALSKMKELFIQELDEYKAGVEDALYKRDSSITGMGFSIWSSSFVNHAIYAAMEASTLNKQEAAANKEYQREIDALHRSITSKHDGAKKTYIDSTYIPNMEAAIAVFAFELLDTYISDMIKNGKLDKSILSYINIDRSNDLLKNLDLSPNKEAILHKAFEACPYNLQVYGKTLNHGLMDYATYQTAQYFRQGKNILFSLVANLGEVEYPSKFKVNYVAAEKMAEFTQSNVISVLQAKTKDYAASVIRGYADVVGILGDRHQAVRIMSELSETAILSGSSVSRGKASACITGIVSQSVWTELTQKCGYATLFESITTSIGEKEASTKQALDNKLEEKLYHLFEEVRQELAKKIVEQNRLKAEAQKAKEAELSKMKKRRKIAIIVGIPVAIIAIILLTMLSNKMELKQQEREAQQRIEQYCTFQLTVQTYSSETACLSALQKLSSEYSDLQKIIRDDWNSYGSEEEIHEALMLELDKNFASVAEEIVSNCSVELEHSAAALVDAFDKHGWQIEYIGEKIAERDYAYAFDNYMDISGKYVEDATYYIINTLYPETFSKGIRERLLHVGVHAWGNTGRELLNSILSYIDSMPEGRTPFESDIATARRQLSEKNAKTGK